MIDGPSPTLQEGDCPRSPHLVAAVSLRHNPLALLISRYGVVLPKYLLEGLDYPLLAGHAHVGRPDATSQQVVGVGDTKRLVGLGIAQLSLLVAKRQPTSLQARKPPDALPTGPHEAPKHRCDNGMFQDVEQLAALEG